MVFGLLAGAARLAARVAPTVVPRVVAKIAPVAARVARAALAVTPAPLKRVAAKVATTVTARIPAITPVTRALRARVGIPAPTLAALPVARTLPIAARPATALKAAVTKVAVGMVEKPFRTALPYAATAGMMGAVSRMGREKTTAVMERGGLVGEGLTRLPSAALGVEKKMYPATVGEVPLMEPQIVRSWSTGTTEFVVDSSGQHWVLTKRGWKKYTPKKPIVLGTKHLTPKKFIAAAKKYYGLKKDLDKVFKTVKRKK